MNLSVNGRAKIEGYEGYHDALPDGSCRAYQRTYNGKKDVPTIGFGCTEGVKMGMTWARAQADEAFATELAKFEAAVTRLVTVELNQNQFDALVSFSYNVGIGALQSSTLLKKLNAGDYAGAAAQFQYWNHAGGGVVNGLTQRRLSESNLFQKPTEAHGTPQMPQTVAKRREPLSEKAAATVGTGLTVATQAALSAAAPSTATAPAAAPAHALVPTLSDLDKGISAAQHARNLLDQAGDIGSWLFHTSIAPVAIGLLLAGAYYIWFVAGGGQSKGASNDSSN